MEITDNKSETRQSLTHRSWFVANIEILIVAAILLLALFSRFYDLGARVMSHDETNHVVPAYDLFQGRGYQYSPVTHGPLKFHLMALSYFVLGDSDFSSRAPAALFSVAVIAFVLFGFRRFLGRAGARAAGFFLLISPIMLFYGRYIRDEAIYVFLVVFILWSILRYLETGEKKYLYCLTIGLALDFTTHEIAYIHTAQVLIFIGLVFVEQIVRWRWVKIENRPNFLFFVGLTIILVVAGLAVAVLGKATPVVTATPTGSATTTAAAATSLLSELNPTARIVVPVIFVLALFSGTAILYFLVKGAGLKTIRGERSFDLLVLLMILVLPLLTALPVKILGFDPLDYSSAGILHTVPFLVVLTLAAIGIGWWWNPRLLMRAGVLFYGIFAVFYTTFFTNGSGFFVGIVGSLGYWMAQQAVNRGTQPSYYYWLVQIPIYEYLPALVALHAAYFGLRHRLWVTAPGKPFERGETQKDTSGEDRGEDLTHPDERRPVPVLALLLFWSAISLVAVSVAGEKMPWLTVNPALGLILAAGWGVGYLAKTTHWERIKAGQTLLSFLLLSVFLAGLGSVLGSLLGSQLPFQGKKLQQLQDTNIFLQGAVISIVSGYFLFRQLARWRRVDVLRVLIAGVLASLAILTIRTSIRASFINYDNAMEFLVYAHGATGSKDIRSQVYEISFRTTGGKAISVSYDSDALYPFWWYFRDYPNKVYFTTPTRNLRNSMIVVASEVNYAKVDAILGDAYYQMDYIRLWWPMEDYKDLTLDRIWYAITNSQMRAAVWSIWFNRDYTLYAQLKDDTDSTGKLIKYTNLMLATWQPSVHFRLYIRKDIVEQMWNYGVTASTAPAVTDPYANGHLTLSADQAIGGPGTAAGSFDAPRQLAFAPDGTLYVADSHNNRIQHLSVDGKVLQVWGTFADILKGSAPGGSFNEPWGVAVGPDGSVYVADTFNFRIQKFTADGQFVTMWGYDGQAEKPEAFWGPRGLAIDAQGRVFVTDTGNKRVVVFDKDGTFVAQFGGAGADPGQFDEPVGIALDAQGNVYVADTWNQRMQVFSQDTTRTIFTPTAQWDISGWFGQSLDNKPFVAVDGQQHVFVTDPEGSRVLEFDSQGKFIRTWGDPGAGLDGIGLASGIAIDPTGHIWVSDAGSNRLLRYTLP